MPPRSNRSVAGFAIIFIGLLATAPEAKLTSLDRRIMKAFETIDVRIKAHEQDEWSRY